MPQDISKDLTPENEAEPDLPRGVDPLDVDKFDAQQRKENEALLELVDAGFVPDKLELSLLYDPRSKYNPKVKVKACAYYMVYGNAAKVSKLINIPAHTIRKWKSEAEWWQPTLQWLRKQKQDELDSMLTTVIHSAVNEIHDRLKGGDYVLHRGQIIRVPVKAKDMAYIAHNIFDKRALLRGDVTSVSGKTVSNLEEIQQQLKKTLEQAKEKDVVATVIPENINNADPDN